MQVSCLANDEDDKLIIINLEWKSDKVCDFFKALDDSKDEIQSPMSK